MPNITVSAEVHERLRARAHRTGRSMAHVANALLTKALDDEILANMSPMDHVAAITRQQGPAAGFQALWLNAGAGLRAGSPLRSHSSGNPLGPA